jgi:hypothetical protein
MECVCVLGTLKGTEDKAVHEIEAYLLGAATLLREDWQ